MIKRSIKETIREYDKDGKLIRETVTETVENDDTVYYPAYYPQNPSYTNEPSAPNPWWEHVTCNTTVVDFANNNEIKE